MHLDGSAIWTAVNREEFTALMNSEGVGHFVQGFYDTDLVDTFGPARRTRMDDLPASLKLSLILGQYMADEYHGRYHAKAQNLRRDLVEAYNRALADVDVLAVPTIQATAKRVPDSLNKREVLDGAIGMVQNRAPFNVSGHPVISLPCGTHDGLPVGMSFVGERGDDATVLRAAHAFERTVDWETVTASD
jgi:amidase